MTRKIHWLSALVLLLAVGAVAVRAEEEEAPPRPMTAELLPAPLPLQLQYQQYQAPVDAPCIRTLPAGMWSFFAPSPVPCPCPLPFIPAAFAPCGDGCGVCPCPTPCTCPTCTCPNCSYCSAPQAFQPAEYVVEMKLLKAGADGDDEVQMCPRVTVLENQTASVEMLGVESSQEQCCHRIQATVMKSVKGVVLNLHVEDSCARAEGEFGGRAHTETTAIRCPVALDTTNKLELVQGVDGAYRSWVEVRVTEVNGKATPTKAAACTCPKVKAAVAEEEDQDDQGLSGAIDVIQGFFEMGADAAAGMAQSCGCCDDKPSVCTPPVNFDGDPLTYVPCTRCSAVEAAKQPTAHVSIDFSHDRKCVEVNNGDKHFKATADHIVMQDDCIRLEGDVRAESCDDSGHTTHITTDHLTVNSKDGAMKIDGATEIHLGD